MAAELARIPHTTHLGCIDICRFRRKITEHSRLRGHFPHIQFFQESSFPTGESSGQQLSTEIDTIRAEAEKNASLKDAKQSVAVTQELIERAKRTANGIHARIAEFVDKRDPHYTRARETLTRFLKSQKPEDLMARVAKTADLADDEMARAVVALQADLKKHRETYQHLHKEFEDAQQAYKCAKRLERRLRSEDFTSSRYEYDSRLDMGSLIAGYMAGRLSDDSVASQVRNYRREVEEETSYSRSNWSSSSNDSWSSGSFSTTDSSGGGSYSSSDSF